MPFFQYSAKDKQGKAFSGTLQAASIEEATNALFQKGLSVTYVQDAAHQQQAARQAPPQSQQSASQPAHQSRTAVREAPARQVVVDPAKVKSPLGEPVKTKPGTEKQIYFIFTQLAAYMRSGISPAQAFANVGANQDREDYRTSLQRAAQYAVEGKRISDVLELYPYLYAPHIVGTIRAGEYGGYLPEAFDQIAMQADSSRKMRRLFTWMYFAFLSLAAALPIASAFFGAMIPYFKSQEEQATNSLGAALLAEAGEVAKQLVWPVGPIYLVIFLLLWIGGRRWMSMDLRAKRHAYALKTPTVCKRAIAESITAFATNLSFLSKAGMAPQAAWMLAATTMPNLEIRRRLEDSGRKMTINTKLSTAFANTDFVPREYVPIVQTGEITGDLPGQLMQAAQATEADFQNQDRATRTRAWVWIGLLLFIGTAIICGFYGNMLTNFIKWAPNAD